jgi:type I restriction enzyme S subunit
MNIEPLFKRFDELADAPERIPSLRKVILAYLLHSAVKSPDAVACAETLREAHEVQRRELIKSASRKNLSTIPDVVDEDLPPSLSDIPAVLFDRLGNIASIEKGLSQIQSTKPGMYPLVVTAEARSSSDSYDFEGAAAIVPLVSSTGHGDASLKRLHYQDGRYAVGNILAVVKPICPDLLRARYIYEYLTAFKEELLVARMVGTANVSLTVNKLKEVPVPLVSGPLLGRIDELMALCDQLEAQQQEREAKKAGLARASLARFAEAPTPVNLEFIFHKTYDVAPADLRKSILTLAVQGKLVPQDPNDEPAEALVRRVGAEKRRLLHAKEIKSEAPLDPISEEEVLPIPDNWIWLRAGDLCRPISSGSTPDQSVFHPSEGIPYLKVYNIRNQFVDFDYKRQFIAVRHHQERMKRSILCPGDVIMNIVGPPLGKVAIVPDTFPEWNCNQAISFFRPIFPEFAPYLYTFLKEGSFLQSIQLIGTAGQDNISVTKCKFIPVPIPPLAEQRRIVAKVEQLMALVDQLEAQLAESKASATKLLEAVLAELAA